MEYQKHLSPEQPVPLIDGAHGGLAQRLALAAGAAEAERLVELVRTRAVRDEELLAGRDGLDGAEADPARRAELVADVPDPLACVVEARCLPEDGDAAAGHLEAARRRESGQSRRAL